MNLIRQNRIKISLLKTPHKTLHLQMSIKTLQENLGHATAAFTLEVYGHVSRQMQISSANKLESFIQNTFSTTQPS